MCVPFFLKESAFFDKYALFPFKKNVSTTFSPSMPKEVYHLDVCLSRVKLQDKFQKMSKYEFDLKAN